MRLFVAIELDPSFRNALVRFLRSCARPVRGVRWCAPDRLHVTIKFLGDAPESIVTELAQVVKESTAAMREFPLTLRGLSAFPRPESPRVLFAAVEDAQQGCRRWLDLADPRLEAIGFPREARPLTPHITLARSKSPLGARALREVLADQGRTALPSERMWVKQVALFESRLRPEGPEHLVVCTAPFGPGP